MADEQTIQNRIAEEQSKINVPSYQDVTLDGAWKRRSNTMFAIGGIGLVTGAVIGLTAPLAAIAGGAVMTGALVAKSVAIFSAIGMSAGWGLGSIVGPSAGATAAAMKEFERRTLAREVEEKIRENPDAKVTLHETPAPQREESDGLTTYFNWRTSLLFAAVGAAAGLVFAGALVATGAVAAAGAEAGIAAFAMPAMKMLLGAAASSVPAVIAYSVGVGASFGAVFGINYPRIVRKLSGVTGDMLSGKAIDAPFPESANLPELKPVMSPVVEIPEQPSKKFADKMDRKPNFEAIVSDAAKEAGTCVTR